MSKQIPPSRKGVILSQETKVRMSISQTGIKRSLHHRIACSKAKIGKNNHFWKGGITKLQVILRNCAKYHEWRKQIFERDNYICIKCKQKGGELQADHMKPFSYLLRENNIKTKQQAFACESLWDINNGRTLCLNCHKQTESYAVKKYGANN